MSTNTKWNIITTVVSLPSMAIGLTYPETIIVTIPVIAMLNFIHGQKTA